VKYQFSSLAIQEMVGRVKKVPECLALQDMQRITYSSFSGLFMFQYKVFHFELVKLNYV